MKIALVVPGGVDRSGVDRVVPALLWQIERLARLHSVHVFALAQEPEPAHWDLLGASVHNVGPTRGRHWRFQSWFAAEHRVARFDLIHAFWAGMATYAAPAALRAGIPYIVHLAGGELVALDDIGYGGCCTLRGRVVLRASLAAARGVSAPSGYMLAQAHAHGCAAREIPLGVALDRWPVTPPRQRDESRPARLLHIGDLRPVKDQGLLLHAAARLRDQHADFTLDIAGFDTLGGEMQRLATQLQLDSIVQWHGVLRRDRLRALVDTSDLLVVTSRHDAGPLVVLEAAIAGVPTIGTAVGHIADWAPVGAAIAAPNDAKELASLIAALLADEQRRLAIAREAQRRAVAIDADYTSMCFERMYTEVIGARRLQLSPTYT
ncbi:MAG TPA: glycosyltransferase family 4 protein [Gemmatimonadaceae bacterium]